MGMFGKVVGDITGLSDIGKILSPQEFNKADSDDFIFNEDNETIYFVIKSKKDEYCFTNLAIIHLDGESAVSSRRKLKRYTYKKYDIHEVWLETAGTVDLDIEIKFTIEDNAFSIDVDKKQIDKLKDLYKALFEISSLQHEREMQIKKVQDSLQSAVNTVSGGIYNTNTLPLSQNFESILQASMDWLTKAEHKRIRDFGDVYAKFINN